MAESQQLDYRWMAERCGVSEITVRNWMSQKNIPPLKQQLIERIMEQAPTLPQIAGTAHGIPGVSVNACISLTIQLASDVFNKLTARAQAEGCTVETLLANAISELVTHPAPLRTRKVTLPTQN